MPYNWSPSSDQFLRHCKGLLLKVCLTGNDVILVPRAHDPSGLWQGLKALALPNFLSMRKVFVSYSQPIRFPRFG